MLTKNGRPYRTDKEKIGRGEHMLLEDEKYRMLVDNIHDGVFIIQGGKYGDIYGYN